MKVKTFYVSNSLIKNQCYLIYNNTKGILIDPAWEYALLNNFIEKSEIDIVAVLLTHAHQDHTDLAAHFAQTKGIPVFLSFQEIADSGFRCENLEGLYHLEEFTIAGFSILPILTPGHTIGSMCYLINSNLFTGDTVFIEGVGICSEDNVHKLYDSVQFLKSQLPENTLMWPGHSFGEAPGKNLAYLLKHNIYFQLERAQFVNFRLRKNQPDPFSFIKLFN